MPKEVMRRTAGDNEYLHKDFHGALSGGIEYLETNFGEDAVKEYLRDFTLVFYAPLTEDLKKRGLVALKEHFERIYAVEKSPVEVTLDDDSELMVKVPYCPAVKHMRDHNYPVARLFVETSRTVNQAMCERTPYAAELLEYDEQTGKSVQRFSRRLP